MRNMILNEKQAYRRPWPGRHPPHHLRSRLASARSRFGACSPAVRPRRWSPLRSAPRWTNSAWTNSKASRPRATCSITTSRRSRPVKPRRSAAPAVAKSVTAPWLSGRSSRLFRPKTSFPYTVRVVVRYPGIQRFLVDGDRLRRLRWH